MNDPIMRRTLTRQEPGEAPLRIARIEPVPVRLPLSKPVVMAGERIEHAFNLLVRVEAENGLVGWGEAASAPLMSGDVLPGMLAAVNDYLAPLVRGQDAMHRAQLARRCARALLHNTGAKCALDMAINDLVGRHLGVSMPDLFGGAQRDTLIPMYLLGNPRIEDDIAEAASKLEEGWSFFKLKIGIKPPLEEARAAVEIRRALGDKVALCADANMGMTFADASLFAQHAVDAGLMFIEQPLHSDDFDGMAALARVSPIPLNGDESIGSIANLLALHRAGAIQGANIKTIKMGGITPTVEAMSLCGALGLRINLAGKVAESSIAGAAIAQLGAVAPNLDWGINITCHYLAEDVTDTPVTIERGTVRCPRGPGLGITVNEAKVRRFLAN
jgi:muconate cycloisomerase